MIALGKKIVRELKSAELISANHTPKKSYICAELICANRLLEKEGEFGFFTQIFGKRNISNICFSIIMKLYNLKGILA